MSGHSSFGNKQSEEIIIRKMRNENERDALSGFEFVFYAFLF